MPKKLLLIDDDPKILALERAILTQGGFVVETAATGEEGLEKLKLDRYDGIILDIMMPAMDGFETARQIKQLDSYKSTPIVMVTATTERNAMTQGFQSGAVMFMNKPFTDKKLLTVVQTVIG